MRMNERKAAAEAARLSKAMGPAEKTVIMPDGHVTTMMAGDECFVLADGTRAYPRLQVAAKTSARQIEICLRQTRNPWGRY